jgi:hypothetical protein
LRGAGQLDHPHLRHLTRALRSVRRDHKVRAVPAEPNQLPERLYPSSGTGASDRLKPESLDDARDDFSVPVLADQHMGPSPPVRKRHHELASVPERKDGAPALTVQGVDLLMTTLLDPHGPPQSSQDGGPDRGQERQLQPPLETGDG